MRKTVLLLASTALAVALAGGVALTAGMGPAKAAFPGANGKIAFASGRAGNLEIYTMKRDGTGVKRLTHNHAYDFAPDWQPLP